MAEYKVRLKRSAFKELYKLPKKDIRHILTKIDGLAKNPRPPKCERLSGSERYRLRHGTYRIIYSIEDDILIVWVIKIGHREDVYP